ncbi:MAG: LacI family DNA-binding transcriptional regulator [Propionibacteriaceae bacterium]|nr:LacI family DNA-binding transcriptional regulator [Propionibacteriaceae bacterium]
MATVYDVAARAGVSVGTVSRYLTGNGYVGEASRARIAAAIAELGYVPNRAAASLTTKATGLLGFVASDLRNPFTAEIASALGQAARANGYGLVLAESLSDPRLSVEAIELMRAHGVDGLIVTPPESPEVNQAVLAAASLIPVVGIGLRTEPAAIDLVTSDTVQGARSALSHLLGLGHRRIAYIGASSMASGRYRGYTQSLADAGIDRDDRLIFAGKLDRQAGRVALDAMLSLPDPPTAVFAANDAAALGVLQEAYSRGLAVPRELSVVGYDDVDLAQHSVPPLTTIAQPMSAMGQQAIDLLLSRLKGDPLAPPREVVLPGRLVVRESTMPPA